MTTDLTISAKHFERSFNCFTVLLVNLTSAHSVTSGLVSSTLYKEITSGYCKRKLTSSECQGIAKIKGLKFETWNYRNWPTGCWLHGTISHPVRVVFNTAESSRPCGNDVYNKKCYCSLIGKFTRSIIMNLVLLGE